MTVPKQNTYPSYFNNYINLVECSTIKEAIDKYSQEIEHFFTHINPAMADYRYAAGKWSIKEVLQHIIDTERIFAYRALSLSRGEKSALAGFNENDYAEASEADKRNWKSLVDEFIACRKSTDLMLLSFSEFQLNQSGITNGNPNTVIAIAYAIFGHILHHINIIQESYLKS